MHPEHKKILSEIKKVSGNGTAHSTKDSYILSGHVYYDTSVPLRRKIAKEWTIKNKDLDTKDFLEVVDSLYRGKSHEEKTLASLLLGYSSEKRKSVTLRQLDSWLGELNGWAEIDSLCQNTFTAEEILPNWNDWEKFLKKLSRDRNINKRRASLVFLTGPTSYSSDKRLAKLAFALMDSLKIHKEIIITKAISWLLRSMVKLHKKEVATYIKKNSKTLPKIALRETLRKIETGRK